MGVFSSADYLTLINALLDQSLQRPKHVHKEVDIARLEKQNPVKLPITGEQIIIRQFNADTDFDIAENWLEYETGRWFLLSRTSVRESTLSALMEDEKNILGLITLKDDTHIGLMAYLDYDEINKKQR